MFISYTIAGDKLICLNPALSEGEEVNLLAWILERSRTHHVGCYLRWKRYPQGWKYAQLFVSVSSLRTLQSVVMR